MPRNLDRVDYTEGFPEGFEAFCTLEDPRTGGNVKHHFGSVVFMVYTCVLCGVECYKLMDEFCDANEEWFSKWIPLPNGTPCYNTFARIMEAIDPQFFAECIVNHLKAIGKSTDAAHIAIDGKALRGSKNTQDRHIHSVSAWACEEGLTLAQTFVSKKSNEITAIPELLKMLNLKDAVVTLDAMGAQHQITDAITQKGGDYLINVKANQKGLHDEIKDNFEFATRQLTGAKRKLNPDNWSYEKSVEISRGREETRQTLVSHNLDWLSNEAKEKWGSIGSVVMVCRHTNVEDGSVRQDVSFYMTSLTEAKAKEMQKYIRRHWSIENSCHWVLDTVFREDGVQVSKRSSAKNLSTLRKIARNALSNAPEISRRKKPASLTQKQLRAAQQLSYREICLSLV